MYTIETVRLLFEKLPIGIILKEISGRNCIYMNQAMLQILEYSDFSTVNQKTVHEINAISQEGAQRIDQVDSLLIESGIAQELELQLDTSAGVKSVLFKKSILNDDAGKPKYILSLCEDLTLNKMVEERHRETSELYEKLIETAPDGVIIFDLHGKVVFASKPVAQIFGLDRPEEAIGHSITEWVHQEDLPQLKENVEKLLKEKHLALSNDYRMKSKNDTFRFIRVRSGVIFSKENRAQSIISYIEDITELRRSQLERERMQSQMYNASKLATLGTLVSGIAHEINNPLTIISGGVSLMKMKVEKLNLLGEFGVSLDKQLNACKRIVNIIGTLRTYGKTDSADSLGKQIEVHTVLDEAVSVLSFLLDKHNIVVERKYFAENARLTIAQARLRQVIVAILMNCRDALEHVETGAVIRMSTEMISKNRLLIQIQDNGCGMRAEVLSRAFDPFFTTKPIGKGMGLGLSISQSIICESGGTIALQSAVGEGTTLKIEIPTQ